MLTDRSEFPDPTIGIRAWNRLIRVLTGFNSWRVGLSLLCIVFKQLSYAAENVSLNLFVPEKKKNLLMQVL